MTDEAAGLPRFHELNTNVVSLTITFKMMS